MHSFNPIIYPLKHLNIFWNIYLSEIIYLQTNEIKKLINKIDNIKDKTLIVTGIEVGMKVSEITQGFKNFNEL